MSKYSCVDPAVESLNNSVQQCSIQQNSPQKGVDKSCDKKDVTEDDNKMEVEGESSDNMETDETTNKDKAQIRKDKQNPEILPATTPMPIKMEGSEKKPLLSNENTNVNTSDDIASENFQKAIDSDAWEQDMLLKTKEALLSKEKPIPLDKRVVKRPQKTN